MPANHHGRRAMLAASWSAQTATPTPAGCWISSFSQPLSERAGQVPIRCFGETRMACNPILTVCSSEGDHLPTGMDVGPQPLVVDVAHGVAKDRRHSPEPTDRGVAACLFGTAGA